ncbi:SpaH/EbpB family LPXTG-anchored major pilin [Lactobacillus delbrueckii]|uniref:SpaH/EbpB family LPXTG-anchored major pilin n=1 Tax=Lactobacillus delbrueckii TaxID=1584 RepID=UPI001E5756F3|nr:SpaH/EbpB family LPXTG-anchored major pilin [Lactobacillus delbrueckii]MCD5568049.1 SpaH/EbpB family LPXTG-anchored major pilin [Lactobacillus delbrueckii subsp. lactis]
MKNKLKPLITGLIMILPLLLLSFATPQKVSAADSVKVTLHNRVFDSAREAKQNTGEIMNDFGGTGLNGVTFKAYNVTDHYLSLRKSGYSAQHAVTVIQSEAKYSVPSYAGSVVATETTATSKGEDGIASFDNLNLKDSDGNYQTYLFVETNSPTYVTQQAAPIVLTMPIYKTSDTSAINHDIQIYPKNVKSTPVTKDLDEASKRDLAVTLPDRSTIYNAQYGQSFGYNIKVNVTWNIEDRDTFNVVDKPDTGIDIDASTVSIDGLTKGTDYTVNKKDNGYQVVFNTTTSAAVQALAGKSLTITYKATLTNNATPDTAIGNTATLNIGNTATLNIGNGTDTTSTQANGPKIYTGGAQFVNKDSQSNKTLAGAKFQLVKVDSNGNIVSYATQASDSSYTWSDSATGATKYTSDTNGLVALKGLSYSDKLDSGESYALLEIKAPDGYAKLDSPVKFSITKGSFDDSNKITIDNTKEGGLLPSTGGKGIYIFLAIGIVIMIVAFGGYKAIKKHEEI